MRLPLPEPDAAADRDLLVEAAKAAGKAIEKLYKTEVKTWSKGAAGPVTEADLAANAILLERLRPARPDYGWLSEETPDTDDRLTRRRVFVIDPLDGTRAFIAHTPDFCVACAVVEDGAVTAAAVFNPMMGEMYAAARGHGATLNGKPIKVSDRTALEGAKMIGAAGFYADRRWPIPWPQVEARKVNALAYRLALIASGRYDGVVALGYKHEWDIAAGALLVAEAGGRITTPWGEGLCFNQETPRLAGVAASGPGLHPLLIERAEKTPHPSSFPQS